ncbi:MvaI/BcnI restriction endonuclease family protein [Zymomonas mobilis]|uniref:MvaI/BcnI family restriction endonuclease n=1 Tax=Zymomonas mobilis TaxID=542 RepID=UPI000B365B33|nr:MvaI/BcnI family restriction endonuclease [Zymomonas mobilis]ART93594.1 hypothetical protein B9T50_05370 [Zymomonas mobilis subsp. mobilis]TWD60308.1 MvaI/BcnI restriction endonuclease family protein [Zymomonas mobilis]
MDNLDKFITAFKNVREMGFVASRRKHNTGIGKTLEDIIGVVENNKSEADLHGVEIKSQRHLTSSLVTLFTKAPNFPVSANRILKDNYGYPDDEYPDINVLHTSIFCEKFSINQKSGYRFSLRVDRINQKLHIDVYDLNNNLINNDIYYTFYTLEKCLKKINILAYISAENRLINGCEEFFFKNAKIFYGLKEFDIFLNEIENRNIMYDIRLGAYKSGKNYGKPHDHGSGFRIKRDNIKSLYNGYIDL